MVTASYVSDEMKELLNRYVSPMVDADIDHLVLGCTHYPYLKSAIREVIGDDVLLVDSGEETAAEVQRILAELELLNSESADPGKHKF